MRGGVTVDAKEALSHLAASGDLLSGKDPRIVIFAHNQHTLEIDKAFLSKRSPEGPRWAPRRHPYSWGMLTRTGTLRGMLLSGFGIKTKDGKPKIFGKVREALYLGGYSRGGENKHKPAIVVAGSVYWGRTKARTARGSKKHVRGWTDYGAGRDIGSATWEKPSTGTTPPRPFFGFSMMAKLRVRQYARREINQVFN